MEQQTITVTNKTQLIVAVGCAMDFPGVTEVTLQHKTGKIWYKFQPTQYEVEMYLKGWSSLERFNYLLKRTRGSIRRTPAECFR